MLVLLCLGMSEAAAAQAGGPSAGLVVSVTSGRGLPVVGARVETGGVVTETGADGVARLEVPAGTVTVLVTAEGYVPVGASLEATGGQTASLDVVLVSPVRTEEEVIVSATRTEGRLDDQPTRVEVLGREEIEEKMLMTPGDIVMMLNEMGGLRVQATAPSLGAASVRIQGMPGRYTRFLADGLPLFGQQVGGLGLLQIPPMDLGQVEVIKGVASALYGAGAMGGVVNLLSRRPGPEAVREVLVNQSTAGATDAVAFLSGAGGQGWSATLLASGHRQSATDRDGDGWADLAHYQRAVVRPRAFWEDAGGRSLYLTAGVTVEDRVGGTVPGARLAATGLPYREALDTRRLDLGASGQAILASGHVVTMRTAAAWQAHTHQFGEVGERDRHDTFFGEVAVRGAAGRHTWVAGAALERDGYDATDLPRFNYAFWVPGIFLQDDVTLAPWVSLSLSGRVDVHSEYGAFASPRVSALVRQGGWTSRVSVGRGFFGPTPLVEETEAAGLSRLSIAGPLEPEAGTSVSIDLTRVLGPASLTATAFAARVAHPVRVRRDDAFVLRNLDTPATTAGVELLGTWRQAPYVVTGTYTYVNAREREGGRLVETALTPRHSAGIVGMAESEEVGRIGVELYFTGAQRLEANPRRARSEAYVVVGLLAERRFGRWSLFVNAENLTDVRQSDWEPLLRAERAIDGRWTVDAWAPLDGRVINGGIRVGF
ncbi:MAG: TonB-dependent receptor [Vicinamibacterales bacterium]